MNLVLDIALTHVRFRVRQTLVAVAGVATGVGFSIMMAALMEGSQDDFTRQLIDALPHITVIRRAPAGAAAAGRGRLRCRRDPRPHARGAPARHQESDGDHGLAGRLGAGRGRAVDQDAGAHPLRRPRRRRQRASASTRTASPRSRCWRTQMRQGTLASLYRATNAIILGDRLAEKIGARIGANITVQTSDGARINAQVVGLFHSGVRSVDEGTAYVLVKTAQILAQQTGLVNELRVRVDDPMAAHERRRSASSARPATSRCPGRRRTRTCSAPSSSATSSCTRWSAPSCWSRASAPTTSSPPSRTRRRATSPS